MKENPTVFDHRRENLRLLRDRMGGSQNLALKLGYSNGSFLGQVAGPNPTKTISEKVAREWEKKLELPVGYFDRPVAHGKAARPPVVHLVRPEPPRRRATDLRLDETPSDVSQKIIAMVYDSARELGAFPEGAKLAIIVDLAIEHAHTAGVDRAYIDRLVRLIGDNHSHK